MLQTRLFADLEEEFSRRGGLAFIGRFDNTLAVSNGISLDQHEEIQKKIGEDYPVTLTFGVGNAESAYEAQDLASQSLQETGSSQSSERREELAGKALSSPEEGLVQIAHLDIDHATGLTDAEPLYDTYHLIQEVYLSLSESFSQREALVFYTGGDNFMAPSNSLDKADIKEIISEVEGGNGIELKAGVGRAPLAVDAAYLASEGLHEIRDGETEEKVVFKESESA